MAGRRVRPPVAVAVASLADTNDPATDRVMIQAEQNLQDLQDGSRRTNKAVAAHATSLASLDTRMTTAEADIVTLQSEVSGRLLATAVLSGIGSSSFPSGTCVVHLRGIGQGGGGGGGNVNGAGAGGSTGAMLDIWIGTPGTPLVTITVNWTGGVSGGGGGSAAGGNGAVGADSTITINGTTYTMKGGGGGQGYAGGAVISTTVSTPPAVGTSSGGVVAWWLGGPGFADPGVTGYSGMGGSSPLGAGGKSIAGANAAGQAGDPGGMGGGGSGGIGGFAGGAGAAGGFVLEAYT